jgi:hypothetical protein
MNEKILKFLGYWALGLIMFVATMIIIRWVVDFITWSSLDSGWAQVIGSLAALAVAIFVMSRQNAHAAHLIVEADLLALRRRAAAISAIFQRALRLSRTSYTLASTPIQDISNVNDHCARLAAKRRSIDTMLAKLDAIPLHELGSFDIADSLNTLHGNLILFGRSLDTFISNPSAVGTPAQINSIDSFMGNVEQASEKFKKGVRDLK